MNQPASSHEQFPIVVLISGHGSNLQAIIDAMHSDQIPICIQAVISDNPDAYGLQRAQAARIPTQIIDDDSFDENLLKQLDHYQPQLIVLSGFMRILGADVIRAYPKKIINIHPSLLPKYKGLHTYQRALDAGDTQHGTTVHFVTDDLDGGPIIAQSHCAIHKDDTVNTLKQRTQELEHQLYPEVIGCFAKASSLD